MEREDSDTIHLPSPLLMEKADEAERQYWMEYLDNVEEKINYTRRMIGFFALKET